MDNRDRLITWLVYLQQPRAGSIAARLSVVGSGQGHIYLRTSFDQRLLYAEAVHEPQPRVPAECADEMDKFWLCLGWNPPTPGDGYCYRAWRVTSDQERLGVALQLEQVLARALGMGPDRPVMIELLDD